MLNKLLTEKEINLFIKKFDTTFDNKLSNYFNYSRVVSLAHFSLLAQTLNLNGDVGVVSGSSNEPELKFINVKSVSLLNFSENIKYDLDSKWDFDEKYDIVVCNQVLERIFSPLQAFSNLLSITKPGGYIYITIPTINCIHGEPYFYSSGFHPRFLQRLATSNKTEILHLGSWGNKKYLQSCVLGRWPTFRQLKKFSIFNPLTINGLKDSKGKYITDTWILVKKLVSES